MCPTAAKTPRRFRPYPTHHQSRSINFEHLNEKAEKQEAGRG
jgi:hypothetical protein